MEIHILLIAALLLWFLPTLIAWLRSLAKQTRASMLMLNVYFLGTLPVWPVLMVLVFRARPPGNGWADWPAGVAWPEGVGPPEAPRTGNA